MPGLRRPCALRSEVSRTVPMQRLSPPDLADRGHDLRLDPCAAAVVVPRHVSPDPKQAGHLQHRAGPPRLGVTQTTAWKIKHKLAQAMMERDASKQLSGRVELDDAHHLGGERTGGKRGRGAPGKTPFVAAVETTPEGMLAQSKLRRGVSFCNHAISIFAKRSLDPSCEVVSDGLACFGAVAKAGC